MPPTSQARLRPLPGAGDRIPPHDLIAEASLLGAMLLTKDALAAGAEVCSPTDFYRPAHARVFEAILALDQRGEPADPTTVADELRRRGELDAIGGIATVVSLQANTPSTSNAERYGHIVRDHALIRELISVSGELADLGFSRPTDVGVALDGAEAKLFTVAQRQVTDSLATAPELVHGFLDDLEAVMESPSDLIGLPTGLHDLDRLLLGLQPSTLNILAARPAMGKTALALNIAANVAGTSQKPVLFFSLETRAVLLPGDEPARAHPPPRGYQGPVRWPAPAHRAPERRRAQRRLCGRRRHLPLAAGGRSPPLRNRHGDAGQGPAPARPPG